MYLFKTSAFLRKNSEEILNKLGYYGVSICSCCRFPGARWINSCPENEYYLIHGLGYTDDEIFPWITTDQILSDYEKNTKDFDCGENEDLFICLVCYRDDTDKGQLFNLRGTDKYLISNEDVFYGRKISNNWEKCNIEEIINYFKNE